MWFLKLWVRDLPIWVRFLDLPFMIHFFSIDCYLLENDFWIYFHFLPVHPSSLSGHLFPYPPQLPAHPFLDLVLRLAIWIGDVQFGADVYVLNLARIRLFNLSWFGAVAVFVLWFSWFCFFRCGELTDCRGLFAGVCSGLMAFSSWSMWFPDLVSCCSYWLSLFIFRLGFCPLFRCELACLVWEASGSPAGVRRRSVLYLQCFEVFQYRAECCCFLGWAIGGPTCF